MYIVRPRRPGEEIVPVKNGKLLVDVTRSALERQISAMLAEDGSTQLLVQG